MSNERNYDVLHLFQTLDAPFLRFDKTKVDPITWQTRNFSVLTRHEVKVPAVAGSTVKYVFSTVGGDIGFELQFQTSSNSQSVAEVIREMSREPSDLEPIKVLYMNAYSYFREMQELLSYHRDRIKQIMMGFLCSFSITVSRGSLTNRCRILFNCCRLALLAS